jgi:hypothetical protein
MRKRAPPLDLSVEGHIAEDRELSPTVSQAAPNLLNGHSTPRHSTTSIPQKLEPSDAQPESSWSLPADDHVRDLRRLIARASKSDECRILVDMFLAKCGALPKDDKVDMVLPPSVSPVPQIGIVTDNEHEMHLIEVLLSDSSTAMDAKNSPCIIANSIADNSSIVEGEEVDPSEAEPVICHHVPESSSSNPNSQLVILSPQAVLSMA